MSPYGSLEKLQHHRLLPFRNGAQAPHLKVTERLLTRSRDHETIAFSPTQMSAS